MELPVQRYIIQLHEACRKEGYDFTETSLYRSVDHQAILWRQSRTRLTIIGKIETLRRDGFGFLANILEAVGPHNGPYVTNACCGESWHNYGMAFDAVPLQDGKPQMKDKDLWEKFGKQAETIGLTWGGRWKSFIDLVHFQMPQINNPLRTNNPDQIKRWLSEAREIMS
jgi:peptidoglycan L-alanyl-D-glutamate endopeptidase CwlK